MKASTLEMAASYLDQLDLSYLCNKMCSSYYSLPRWQPPLASICEMLYKRFLWLLIKFPDQQLTPTRDIDEFWHNHILYTKQYVVDCNALLGRYIHHQPSDPDDKKEMTLISDQFRKTQALYFQEYGEKLVVLKRE